MFKHACKFESLLSAENSAKLKPEKPHDEPLPIISDPQSNFLRPLPENDDISEESSIPFVKCSGKVSFFVGYNKPPLRPDFTGPKPIDSELLSYRDAGNFAGKLRLWNFVKW